MRHVQLAAMFIVMAAIGPWAGSALAADPPGGLKEKEAQSERLAKEGLTGTLATIDGEFYVVEDSDGQMHRLHVDKSTKLDKLAVGDKVKAFVTARTFIGWKHVVRGNTVDVPEERYGTCQAPWDSGDNA
jgi:hypothetical protein